MGRVHLIANQAGANRRQNQRFAPRENFEMIDKDRFATEAVLSIGSAGDTAEAATSTGTAVTCMDRSRSSRRSCRQPDWVRSNSVERSKPAGTGHSSLVDYSTSGDTSQAASEVCSTPGDCTARRLHPGCSVDEA